jgi:23S rRNA (cytidine1920-2'-O)/16S rRNA (cytidine1409-2'-O)-methyltransferase
MKRRADELLVLRELAPTRSKARALIMAGQVRSGDRVIDKAGTMLEESVPIEIDKGLPYVSRGGLKLAHSLDAFAVDPTGLICADFGASTGGFTDVLLQRGAKKVYAIDVGYGQLDYSLRTDERVVAMERTNVRYLESLPDLVDLVTIDVSFISLSLIFPVVARVLRPGSGVCIALIKPQFEAGRENVGKGGVVRDTEIHRRVLKDTGEYARSCGLHVGGIVASPVTGPAGNREFLGFYRQTEPRSFDVSAAIEAAVKKAELLDV